MEVVHDSISQMMFKITGTEKGFPLISAAFEPYYQWDKKEKEKLKTMGVQRGAFWTTEKPT